MAGLNLHQLVRGYINVVNPDIDAVLRKSAGYTIDDDGTQIPAYEAPVTVSAQVQSLTTRDLRQLEALNIQNAGIAVYFNGVIDGVLRVSQKGGDLVEFPAVLPDNPELAGTVWLTTNVLEQWPTGWCKVSLTLQNGS